MEFGVTAVMLPEVDFEEQVELCVSLGVRLYQFRPRHIPVELRAAPFSCWGNHRFDLTPERLLREGRTLTSRLEAAGMRPWGTVPAVDAGASDGEIALHLDGAAAARSGRMRLSPPAYPEGTFDVTRWIGALVERYERIIAGLARPRGIRLLIETHAGGAASSPGVAWNIVRALAPGDIGVILDLGNFAREGEISPSLAISLLRDWIDCVHVGGSRRRERGVDALGSRLIEHESCAPSDSDLHIPTWIAALHAAGIDPPLIIEDYAMDAPGPDRLRRDVRFLAALPELEGRRRERP